MNDVTQTPAAPSPEKVKKYGLVVLLIVCLGFVLRLAGIRNMEPSPDDQRMMENALFFWEGYPPFFWEGYGIPMVELWAAGFAAVWAMSYHALITTLLAAKDFPGILALVDQGYRLVLADPRKFALIPMAINTAVSCLLIACSFGISRRLFDSGAAGLIAALSAAFSPMLIRLAPSMLPDTMLAFAFAGSIYFSIRHVETGGMPSLVMAGIMAGLAAATKFIGVVAVPSLLLCVFLSQGAGIRARLGRAVLVSAAAGITFLILNPYPMIDFTLFLKGIYHRSTYLYSGAGGYAGHMTGFWSLIGPPAWSGMGYLVSALAAAGLLLSLTVGLRKSLVLMLALASYLFLMNSSGYLVDRYAAPLAPIAAALAGGAAGYLASTLWKKRGRSVGLLAGALLIVAAVPVWGAYNAIELKLAGDTMTSAREWILANVTPDSRIFITFEAPALPYNKTGIERAYDAYADRLYKNRNDAFPTEFFRGAILAEERYLFKKFSYLKEGEEQTGPGYDIIEITYMPEDKRYFEGIKTFWVVSGAGFIDSGEHAQKLAGELIDIVKKSGKERIRFPNSGKMGNEIVIYEVVNTLVEYRAIENQTPLEEPAQQPVEEPGDEPAEDEIEP